MVRHEVIQDLTKPDATLVAEWIRCNEPHKLTVGPTEVLEELMLLRSINPATKIKNRGEQAAAEVLERTGRPYGQVRKILQARSFGATERQGLELGAQARQPSADKSMSNFE